MDQVSLHDIFKATFNADLELRKQAEGVLKQLEREDGFVQLCLKTVSDIQVDIDIRMAAAIYTKNFIDQAWADTSDTETQAFIISPTAKSIIKQELLSLLKFHLENRLERILLKIFNSLIISDLTSGWEDIWSLAEQWVLSNNELEVNAGIIIFLEVSRFFRYQNSTFQCDQKLFRLLPLVISLCKTIVEKDNILEFNGIILYRALKGIRYVCDTKLSKIIYIGNILHDINFLMVDLIKKNLVEFQLTESNPWIKAKKWATRILLLIFEYLHTSSGSTTETPEMNDYSNYFVKTVAPEIVELYLQLFEKYINSSIALSRPQLFNMLMFFYVSIHQETTWRVITPYLEKLIVHLLYPFIRNDLEISDWDSPEIMAEYTMEYFYKSNFNISVPFKSPDNAAQQLIAGILRKDPDKTFPFLLRFIYDLMNFTDGDSIDDQALSLNKRAAMKILVAIIPDVIINDGKLTVDLEPFISKFVINELASPVPFLRSQSLRVISSYSREIRYNSKQPLSNKNPLICLSIDRTIYSILFDDYQVIQIEALIALQNMLPPKDYSYLVTKGYPFYDYTCSKIAFRVPLILSRALELGEETNWDELGSILDELLIVFPIQLKPYIVDLTNRLTSQLVILVDDVMQVNKIACGTQLFFDAKEEEIKKISALGIFSTLRTILSVSSNQKEILDQIGPILYPLFCKILNHDQEKYCYSENYENSSLEFYDEMFELVGIIIETKCSVPKYIWSLVSTMIKNISNSLEDCSIEIVHCLNMLVKFHENHYDVDRQTLKSLQKLTKQVPS